MDEVDQKINKYPNPDELTDISNICSSLKLNLNTIQQWLDEYDSPIEFIYRPSSISFMIWDFKSLTNYIKTLEEHINCM